MAEEKDDPLNDPSVQVKLRMRQSDRDHLKREAQWHGNTLNTEILNRIHHTFNKDIGDRILYGHPEVANVVRVMAGAFAHGGAMAAKESGHPEWEPKDWIDDEYCFLSAAGQAHATTLSLLIELTDEESSELMNSVSEAVTATITGYLEKRDNTDGRDDNETREE